MYLFYITSLVASIMFNVMTMYLYGRTHKKYNGPDGISGLGEAQKCRITKDMIPGLQLTITMGLMGLSLSTITTALRFTLLKNPQGNGSDYIPIIIGLSIFVLVEVLISTTQLVKLKK